MKYKVTKWVTSSVPIISYVDAISEKEAEEKMSTVGYYYDYENIVFGEMESIDVKEEDKNEIHF